MGYPWIPNPGASTTILTSTGTTTPPTWQAPAVQTIPGGWYGDGSDGTADCDGSTGVSGMSRSGNVYTQTRDCYFANLTINAGKTVNGAGFRMFVSGTFTVNGRYAVDGGAGTTSAGGAGGGGGYTGQTARLAGGGIGGAFAGAPNISNGVGGAGGNSAGSAVNSGGSVTAPNVQDGMPRDVFSAVNGFLFGLTSGSVDNTAILGGAGGGAVSSGGNAGGGGGGGYVVVCANTLAGSGSISANGGAGCANSTNFSGGGGGGFVVLVTRTQTSWSGTVTASGGASGGGSATAGSAGLVLQFSI
jgi:hypothetical protein